LTEQFRSQPVSFSRSTYNVGVTMSILIFDGGQRELRIARDGLKAALTEVQLARERFRLLSSNSLELSNALFSLVRARDNMIDGLFRANASRVNLARAMGQVEALR
jgi:outer membrane protein TolC